MNMNPIYETDNGWFFWDEVWANEHGPYKTYEKATQEFNRYCDEYLGEKE